MASVKLKNRVRKTGGVDKVFRPRNAPSYFGLKEAGEFDGYELIIFTREDFHNVIDKLRRRFKKFTFTPIGVRVLGMKKKF